MAILSASCLFAAEAADWPVIQPVRKDQTLVRTGDGGDTPVLLLIKDRTGANAYQLECHNGDYDDPSGFNFSGDFQCALFAFANGRLTSENLLETEAESKAQSDWFNRGRFLTEQIRGRCAAYREYGAVRHFRLRGMLVTLRLDGLRWFPLEQYNRPTLKRFTFSFSAAPEDSAKSAVAEEVSATPPPKSCQPIPF